VAERGRRQVYGLHAVRALVERRPESIRSAAVLAEASGPLDALARELRGRGVAVSRLRRPELDRLAGGGRHQGVVVEAESAAAELELADFESLVAERGRALRVLILDGVEESPWRGWPPAIRSSRRVLVRPVSFTPSVRAERAATAAA
jgi:23S rRNA (guanosine2251-2'-O)-methyltransferase